MGADNSIFPLPPRVAGTVFLLLRHEEGCDFAWDEVQGVFATEESAMAEIPGRKEGRWRFGWRRHGKTGELYFGRTDTKADDYGRTHWIQPRPVR